jgi:sugar/nucleoside kinase (ribokinase family)
LGGGAANAAVALARLGLKVGIITRVGNEKLVKKSLPNSKTRRLVLIIFKLIKKMTGFSFILATAKKKRSMSFYPSFGDEYLLINQKELSKISASWII